MSPFSAAREDGTPSVPRSTPYHGSVEDCGVSDVGVGGRGGKGGIEREGEMSEKVVIFV